MFAGNGLGQAFDLVNIVLITQLLGLAGFGLFVAARALAGFVNLLLSARSWETLLAFWPSLEVAGEHRMARQTYVLALWIEIALILVGAGSLSLLGALFPGLLQDAGAAWLLLPLAYLRPASNSLLEANQAVLRLQGSYWVAAVQAGIPGILRFIALGLLVVGGIDNLALCLLVDGLGSAVVAVTGVFVVRGKLDLELTRFPAALWQHYGGRLRAFVSINWVASCGQAVTTYGAELMLIGLGTETALAIYGLARRFAGALGLMVVPFLAAAVPQMVRFVSSGDWVALRATVLRVSRDAMVLVLIANVLLFALGAYVAGWISGGDFAASREALLVLLLGMSLHFVTAWFKPVMLAAKLPGIVLLAQLLMALVLVVSAALLIPQYQALGAAAAVSLGYFARTLVYGGGLPRLASIVRSFAPPAQTPAS